MNIISNLKNKSIYQEYELEPHAGESIFYFADRLLNHFKLVNTNKMVLYAAMICNKIPVTVAFFNDRKIIVKSDSTKESIIQDYKNANILAKTS